MPKINENNIPLVEIFDDLIQQKGSRLFMLREDLLHPEISGNKWRKLKYNIQEAINLGHDTILTFGGAYSNHIAATAAAGKHFGLNTVGIIRGEEHLPLNSTLELAVQNGMKLKYVSREQYRNKTSTAFLEQLNSNFGNYFLIPEGGSNGLAVKGCTEILKQVACDFDVVCCACGTGGTIAGLIASANKEVIGFPALKGGAFLYDDIEMLLKEYATKSDVQLESKNWSLNTDYHFGGYAKIKDELIEFVRNFYQQHAIKLDLIYTGKMMYGIYDLLRTTKTLDNKTIVAIHTGGLQGNKGFEQQFKFQLF